MSTAQQDEMAIVPRRRQPRWTDEEFKTLLEAACMCGANFERIAKIVGVRRAPDACRKQLRVVAERLLYATPETSEACVHVILAKFGLEHPTPYEGQSFANTKDAVFVQALPKSEMDELEVRRCQRNPLVQMKSSSSRTMWYVMYHLFFKWGLPIVLCNPDGSIISPDEPTGSVLARLQTVEDKESYVKVHYHVLQLQIDDKLLARLRSGAPTVPPSLPQSNEAVNEFQHPMVAPELEYEGEIYPVLEVVQNPTPEVLPNAINPAELMTVDIANLPVSLPPPPMPPQLPDGFDYLTELAKRIQCGWSLNMSEEGQVDVTPPSPPPLPPRRICNSRRTYAWPPSSNSIDVEDAMLPPEGVELKMQELDGALFGLPTSPSTNKPPSGKKKAVPAQRRIAKKGSGTKKSTPKRQRAVTSSFQSLPAQETSSISGDEVMKKWAARLQTMEEETSGENDGPELETQAVAAQNEVQPQVPDETPPPPLQKTDSIAQITEAMIVETGNSTVIRMFRNIASHETSCGPAAAASQAVKPVDDSIALEARRFGFENQEENVPSLPNNSLFGRSTPASAMGENPSGLDLNLTMGVGELDISHLPPALPQGSGLSGLFGSKENSRTAANFLRSDASIDRDSKFHASDNALDVFVDSAATAHAEARNPLPNFPSLTFSGMFSRGGSPNSGKK